MTESLADAVTRLCHEIAISPLEIQCSDEWHQILFAVRDKLRESETCAQTSDRSAAALAKVFDEFAENPKGGKMAAIAYAKCAHLVRVKLCTP